MTNILKLTKFTFKSPVSNFVKNFIKKYSFLIILILLALGLVIYGDHPISKNSLSLNYAEQTTIVLTDNGFAPDVASVKIGGTVTFVNDSSKPFWPASDLHPTHSIYPEFDPKQPIEPNGSWTFSFDKPGRWRYHDHLNPGFTGIVVVGEIGQSKEVTSCPVGDNISDSQREQCWDDLIVTAIQTKGAKTALDILHTLYNNDPNYVKYGCHKHAHQVGEAAYAQYLKTPNLDDLDLANPETTSCGYGFWHGFLEHLIRDHPSIEFGRQFCAELVRKYVKQAPNINFTCYHGMGHGFMPEIPDQRVWGHPVEMSLPALQLCDKVSPTNSLDEIKLCHQGVFNVLADWYTAHKYRLIPNQTNPLAICPQFNDDNYRNACYYEFGMRVSVVAGDDIIKTAQQFVDQIPDDDIAKTIIDSAMASIIERSIRNTDYSNYIAQCQNLAERLRQDCLIGIVGGLMAHGEPGQEYVKTLAVCRSPVLDPKYIDICYQQLSRKLKRVYTFDKVTIICATIDEPYRKYCQSDFKPMDF